MKQMKVQGLALLLALLTVLSLTLGACGDATNTASTGAATTSATTSTTAAATTASTAITTAAMSSAAMTTASSATTAAMSSAAMTTASSATTAAMSSAAMTTASSATTAAMTTAGSATTAATTGTTAAATTGGGNSVTVDVNGTQVVLKAGGGQTFQPSAPVNIKIWSSQTKGNGTAFRTLMDGFEKTHPNIKVTLDNFNDTATYNDINTKLSQAATAGGLPNIATGYENWVPPFVDAKIMLGLSSYVSGPYGLSAKDLSDYRPQMLARGIFPQYNNEIYTWVFSNSGPVMYYNKDILDQAGITKIPETWDEFVAASKTISEKVNGVAGYIFNPKTVSEIVAGFYTRGGKVFDYGANKFVFTDKPAVDHLSMLYNGVKDGSFITSDPNVANDDQNKFVDGKAAFYISSTSSRSFVAAALAKASKQFNWNGAILPHGTGLQPLTTLYGGAVLGFKGKSDDENNATWEVMKFLGSAPFQAQWASNTGYVPATKSTIDDPTYKAFLDKAPQNKIPVVVFDYAKASEPKLGIWQQVRTDFDNNVFALFQNASGTPADTLKKIEDNGNKLLAK